MMQRPSLTFIFVSLFMVYIAHSMWTIYGLFVPEPCPPTSRCLRPFLLRKPHLELQVYTSLRPKPSETHSKLAWKSANFSAHEAIEQEINVTIPSKTKKNGTLYTHVFLVRKGESPFHSNRASHSQSLLTTYIIPKAETFNLMGDAPKKKQSSGQTLPITHWRTRLVVNVMTQDVTFSSHAVPADVHRFLQLSPEGDYLPILYIDELSYRIRDLQPVNESVNQMPLTVSYSPISLGKLRLWVNMQESMRLLQNLGFTEKDMDEVKGIFSDTNLYFLMMTFLVAALHLLFDFLAFKNDISYWKKRETMVGLSSRVVVWRCVSTMIIFLYLMDEETSMLVLVPAGVGTIIEMWKVKKAFKVQVEWAGIKPKFIFGTKSDKEKETEEFDLQAMKYLSYLLYPLCAVGAVYSLIYNPHKSWYSWCIQSLVNGVYAFGFLFMLPQLFVNYKLKSVAHLPWRAFMYKAFNTFIDDIFAFIITMPTAHRLACFRDDIIFLIYLYQRWLYPVDKKRVNEFGQSFEEEASMKEENKKTK